MDRRTFISTSLAATAAMTGIILTDGLPLSEISAQARSEGEKRVMKILVLTGSPRKNSNSGTLAEAFIKGAREAGHDVVRFDAAASNVHACVACNSCGMDGPCIFQDDFETVRDHIIPADVVVFATPMYYFGMSSQLKAVIDRFYAINGKIHVSKKAVLLMTYANTSSRDASPMLTQYEVLLDYLGWQDAGRVVASGVWPAGAIKSTSFPEQAYQLGKSL